MANIKQQVSINFSQGLNTKTDPWQLPIGQFEDLQNSIFQKGGLLQKRPGYGSLTNLSPNNSYLTTLNNNLVSIGNTVSAYSSSLENWITKGTLQPCSLSVLPLINNNFNQTQNDTAIANGLVCTVYTETNNSTSAVVTQYLYAIADAITGQNIVQPSAMPVLATGAINGSSRVFVVGNYFVIVSPVLVSGSTFLQYCSVPINNPVNIATNAPNVSAAQNVHSEVYVPTSSNPGWDGVVSNGVAGGDTLVVAYNTTASGQGVHVTSLSVSQIQTNSASSTISKFTNAAYIASILSICVDLTATPNIFYISFWNSSTGNGYTAAVTVGLGSITQVFTPKLIISDLPTANLASAAQNGSCQVFSEQIHTYSGFSSSQPTNFINSVSVSAAGTVGTPYVAVRSLGLASKAFIVNSVMYFLAAHTSEFQPTYFLMNGSTTTAALPVTVAKLASENGGGYLALGLPSVNVADNVASVSYLYKNDVEALNTLNNPQQTTAGGIYSQDGIKLVNFTIGTLAIDTTELASNLHISGGYLSHFDGYLPYEHNFFIWPELDISVPIISNGESFNSGPSITYTEVSTVTPTGTASSGSFTITVSSATGIFPGMTIADSTNSTYIPAGTSVVLVNSTTITMSAATTHAISGDTLSIQGNIAAVPTGGTASVPGNYYYQVTYEWTDNQGLPYRSSPSIPITIATAGTGTTGTITLNIPTLRVTSKVANPVKIVVYRWSENTQVYNQVTSITAPLLNSTTVDFVTFVDTLPDAQVVGNNILYTTGGVVEDSNAPASDIMTIFDTRHWLVSSEDPNTLWLSKTVVEGVPVEMSDEFTIYISPNTGTVSSTGPITALAPMDDKLIIFKENAIYYMNGTGPNNLGTTQIGSPLGQYSPPIFITAVVGCTNQASIVLTDMGLMFQSDKGIWLLNRGLQTTYIGSDVEDFNSYTVNSAQVIPGTNYVLFSLNTNTMLMYDYFYQQWGTFVGVSAISSCIFNSLHTVIDIYGRILQQSPGTFLDATNPVNMSYTTSWINVAGLQGYEGVIDFFLLGKFLSPHSLLVEVAYDYNDSVVHSKLITPTNYSSGVPSPFGVPTPFGSPGNKEQFRIHMKKQLCESFKITVTEVFNPAYGTSPGAGFTMSGLTATVRIKKGTRPIKGSNSTGMS